MSGGITSTTVAWVSAISAVASIGMGTYSAIASAENAKEQADYQKKVAEYNANEKEKQAMESRRAGAQEAAESKQRARAMNANFTAKSASMGLLSDTGTALELQTENAGFGERDAAQTYRNADLAGKGLQVEASNYLAQGQLAQMEGSAKQTQGYMNAAGSLLSRASSMASTFKWDNGLKFRKSA